MVGIQNVVNDGAWDHPIEACRCDSDDLEVTLVDADRPTDDVRVGTEAALPQSVADHSHRVAVRYRILLRAEESAEERPNTQHGEVVGRHDCALQLLRPPVSGDIQWSRRVMRYDCIERARLRAEQLIGSEAEKGLGLRTVSDVEPYQAISVRDR